MEKDKKKIKEPYRPDETPKPPQIVDPETREDRDKPSPNAPARQPARKNRKPGLLADNADIDDETTI